MRTSAYLEEERCVGGGTSGVRTCHGPGFTAVCFLPSSPAVTAALVSESKSETPDVDATAAAQVVCHARRDWGGSREAVWRAGGGVVVWELREGLVGGATVRSAPRGHPLVGAPHQSQTSFRRSQSLPPPVTLPPPSSRLVHQLATALRPPCSCLAQSRVPATVEICTRTYANRLLS